MDTHDTFLTCPHGGGRGGGGVHRTHSRLVRDCRDTEDTFSTCP